MMMGTTEEDFFPMPKAAYENSRSSFGGDIGGGNSQQELLTQQPDLTQMGEDYFTQSQQSQLWSPEPLEQQRCWAKLMPIREGKPIELLEKETNSNSQLLDHPSTLFAPHTMGRNAKCDITIEMPPHNKDPRYKWAFSMISNHHCKIYGLTENGTLHIYLEDTSQNGTLVNKTILLRKGERRLLHSGDEISLNNPRILRRSIRDSQTLQEILEYSSFVFIKQQQQQDMKKAVDIKAMRWHSHVSSSQQQRRRSPRRQPTRRMEEEYDVRDLLGTGTVGEVRRAIHRKSGEERAIKIIHSQRNRWQAHLDSTAAFEAEAGILRELNHPYIVNLIDVYVTPQTVYMIMDLLHGGDLFDRIVEKGKYSEIQARRVMRRLLSAIHYLHEERNIVHRDIKPENILLYSRDNDVQVKLTDFGLAKAINGDEGLKTFCGTPQYFAPEVLRRRHTVTGRGRYGKQADMWSIGVVLYVLLSGMPPFDVNEGIDVVADAKIEFPASEWEEVSDKAKDLILKLLSADPHERATVTEACNHDWIMTNDGDTHVHPLDDPQLDALKKQLFLENSRSAINENGKSVLEEICSEDRTEKVEACANRKSSEDAPLAPIENKADMARADTKPRANFAKLELTSARKTKKSLEPKPSQDLTPATSNRKQRPSTGAKSSNDSSSKPSADKVVPQDDILSYFSETTDSITSFSTLETVGTKAEIASPGLPACTLTAAVVAPRGNGNAKKGSVTKRRITDSLESIFAPDARNEDKPKSKKRKVAQSASQATPKRGKRKSKKKQDTPPSGAKQTTLSTWFRKVN